jgi:hypothetical protein
MSDQGFSTEFLRKLVASKDAEIERLDVIVEMRNAEIEQLKNENETLRAANASFEGGMHWRDGIIAKLADALEEADTMLPYTHEDIINEARESTV